VKLQPKELSITRAIRGARYLLAFARGAVSADGTPAEELLAARCAALMAAETLPYRRDVEGVGKMLDVRTYLRRVEVAGPEAQAILAEAGLVGDLVVVDVDAAILQNGAVKAQEIAAVLMGETRPPPHRAVRAALFGEDEAGKFSPLESSRAKAPPKPEPPKGAEAVEEAAPAEQAAAPAE
jgi:hypothetical protein